MFILSQVMGVGDFSIANNLRLIIIAAIFVGIIVVLLCIRFARSGRKANEEYASQDKDEESEDVVEETEEQPVVNYETIDDKIKISETEIINKIASVIKDVNTKSDAKLTAEIEGIRAEFATKIAAIINDLSTKIETKHTAKIEGVKRGFATKIEELMSMIEEREKGVVNKIENVIDTKVEDALTKMNNRIGEALHTQKNSTALVLEKLVDSLRMDEVPSGSFAPEEEKQTVDEKVGFKEAEKKDFWNMLKETSVKDKGILGELASSLQTEEEPVNVSPSDEFEASVDEAVVPEETKKDELKVTPEHITEAELEKELPKEAAGGSADCNVEELLKENPVDTPPTSESDANIENNVIPEEIKGVELAVPSEHIAEAEPEKEIPEEAVEESTDFDMQKLLNEKPAGIPPTGEPDVSVENDVIPEEMVGETADFDIQKFMDEEPVGIPSTGVSDTHVEETVTPEETKTEEPEASSEHNVEVKLENEIPDEAAGELADLDIQKFLNEEPVGVPSIGKSDAPIEKKIATDEVKEEKVPEKSTDTVDFDIQSFLEELESLPTEKDPDTEK